MTDPDIPQLDVSDELIAERRSDSRRLPPDMEPWMRSVIIVIDTFSLWVGRAVCLLLIPMLFSMVYEIIARKFFIAPTLWAYDISRMTMGAMFMLGAGYALMKGVHIRADFLYRIMSERNQGRVDLALYLIFYFPSLALFFWITGEYALGAVRTGETSMDTAWMPIVWPARMAMPVGAAFLLIQGVSEVLKCVHAIRKGRWP
jgi:TRAP-type mannitol/chloroaromatic compound transport system permease small subunit